MDPVHAIILALLQGAFELFPVSSLGHTVLVPALLGWNEWQKDDPNNASFVAYVVVLHLGTAIALLTFFWRDWVRVVTAVLRSVARRDFSADPDERLGWLVLIGSLPAGILGFLLQKPLESLFDKAIPVSIFLILNGVMMLAGERVRRRQEVALAVPQDSRGGIAVATRAKTLADVGVREGLAVGAAQALALLPGFSRSGSTIVAGLLVGLRHADAARYSFMLATPIILAANLVKAPDLFAPGANVGPGLALIGTILSGITAYLAVRFLMRYFATERLDPFGWYCVAFGSFCLVLFAVRGL